MSAYDVVAQWIAERKLSMSAAFREVYFIEVRDVVYPI
jgi:effector-binding domain-containing protein